MIDPVANAVAGATAGVAAQHVSEPILAQIPFVYKAAAFVALVLFLIWYYALRNKQGRKRRG